MESILFEKGLQKSDLQVNLKKETATQVATSFIERDWWSFGECFNLEIDRLNEIKEKNQELEARKAALLFILIDRDNIRYEDIIYGHYKINPQSKSIDHILDFLVNQRTKRGTT